VQFDPTTTGAVTGQLTIKSNSTTNSTAAIALTGTGAAASYSVDLGWDAPTDSVVPIAGYNVYRAVSGSSSYLLLNTALDAQTAYVDSSVQPGVSYDYMIESVDTSGVESAPTNPILVTVP
jgi:fibronectin type 3 domain-containing protein